MSKSLHQISEASRLTRSRRGSKCLQNGFEVTCLALGRKLSENETSQAFVREAGFTATCQNVERFEPLNEHRGQSGITSALPVT